MQYTIGHGDEGIAAFQKIAGEESVIELRFMGMILSAMQITLVCLFFRAIATTVPKHGAIKDNQYLMIRMSGLCFLSFSSQFPPADRINAGNFPLNRNIGAGDLLNWLVPGKKNAGILGGKSADGSFVALPDEFQYQPFIEEARPPRKGCAVPSRTTFMDDQYLINLVFVAIYRRS